jgi:predicted RNase H-like HicB family nuclease
MRPTYTVVAERDRAWWVITVPELRGVFSQARRLSQVEPMARDAISLLLDVDQDSFDLLVREGLDPEAERVVADAIRAREDAVAQQRVAATKSREAVRALERLGLPQRDIGRLLGLSHQRVAQLLSSAREG